MKGIKNLLFRNIQEEDESMRSALSIRFAMLIMLLYCFMLFVGSLVLGSVPLGIMSLFGVGLHGLVLYLTYGENVRKAAGCMNILSLTWILFCCYHLGTGTGIQSLLYVLLLTDFFLSYWKLRDKLIYAFLVCALRIGIFCWFLYRLPAHPLSVLAQRYVQVATILSLFGILSLCGCLVSMNVLAMEQELLETNRKLRHLAETDPLTQLMNRMSMQKYADNVMKGYVADTGMSVAIADIDFFKKFNDTYGHECGDVVLKTLAGLFMEFMKAHGAVARWGGEEFLFLFVQSNGDDAYCALSELRSRVKALEIPYGEEKLKVTMTFGLTEINFRKPLDINIREADDKLYRGKEHGRDQIVY